MDIKQLCAAEQRLLRRGRAAVMTSKAHGDTLSASAVLCAKFATITKPRFIVTCNFKTFRIYDREGDQSGKTYEQIELAEL